jgi:hypothetical protein
MQPSSSTASKNTSQLYPSLTVPLSELHTPTCDSDYPSRAYGKLLDSSLDGLIDSINVLESLIEHIRYDRDFLNLPDSPLCSHQAQRVSLLVLRLGRIRRFLASTFGESESQQMTPPLSTYEHGDIPGSFSDGSMERKMKEQS